MRHLIGVLVCSLGLLTQASCGDGSRMRTAQGAESLPAEKVGLVKKMYKGSRLDLDGVADNDSDSFLTVKVAPGIHKAKLTIISFPDYHYSGAPIVTEWDMPVKAGYQNEVWYDTDGEHRVEIITEEVNLSNPKEVNKIVVRVVKL
ncbi:MAG: hypothetical protein ACXWUG_22895 [Polyangiales bacterium]